MDKFGLPIMPCTPIFTSRPVNPGRFLSNMGDRLTGRHMNKYRISITHNLSKRKIDKPRAKYRNERQLDIMYLFTCRPINLSTCPSGLIDPGVYREVLGIMGETLYLSTQGDMLTGRHVTNTESKALWVFRTCSTVDLSTCLPGLRIFLALGMLPVLVVF